MTVAVAVTVPCGLEAVIVYVVDVVGEIFRLDDRPTEPTVGLMETEAALTTSHDIIERPPSFTKDGVDAKYLMTGRLVGVGGTIGADGVFFMGAGVETVLLAVMVLFELLAAPVWGVQPRHRQADIVMTETSVAIFVICNVKALENA
jgi:hypothetical protein